MAASNNQDQIVQKTILWILGFALSFGIFFMISQAIPTSTAAPTDVPPTMVPATATLAPTLEPTLEPTIVLTATPEAVAVAETATPFPPCEWLPISDTVALPEVKAPGCFDDLLRFGMGEKDGDLLFYKNSQRLPGYYGLSKFMDQSDSITATVSINDLQTIRFLVALSPSGEPNDSALAVRIHSDDGKNFVLKVLTIRRGGHEKEISVTPAYKNWGKTFKVTFQIDGSRVKVYVNDIVLGQAEIDFNRRYLFVGFQAMPVPEASTSMDVVVDVP
jgi:hypothetical protein